MELLQVERLVDVVEGASLHRLDGRVRGLGDRDEDRWHTSIQPSELFVYVEPGAVWQLEIEEHHIRWRRTKRRDPVGAVRGDRHVVCGEGLAHLFHDKERIVVDEQEVSHAKAAAAGSANNPRSRCGKEVRCKSPPMEEGPMAISSRAGARDQDSAEFGARAPTTRRGGPSARVELSLAFLRDGTFS